MVKITSLHVLAGIFVLITIGTLAVIESMVENLINIDSAECLVTRCYFPKTLCQSNEVEYSCYSLVISLNFTYSGKEYYFVDFIEQRQDFIVVNETCNKLMNTELKYYFDYTNIYQTITNNKYMVYNKSIGYIVISAIVFIISILALISIVKNPNFKMPCQLTSQYAPLIN